MSGASPGVDGLVEVYGDALTLINSVRGNARRRDEDADRGARRRRDRPWCRKGTDAAPSGSPIWRQVIDTWFSVQ